MTVDELMAKRLGAGREYRKFNANDLVIRDKKGDDDAMFVEGYASTFNEPYELFRVPGYTVNEQIDPRAFDECDMSDVIMQYDHEGRVFARKSNHTLEVNPDERGLFIRADLSGTEIGRQLYSEIKGGYTTKMSFGFVVDTDTRLIEEDKETGAVTVLRTITKIRKLYDVSAVSLPANDATEISARNLGDGLIKEITEERRQRAKAKLQLKLKLMEVK